MTWLAGKDFSLKSQAPLIGIDGHKRVLYIAVGDQSAMLIGADYRSGKILWTRDMGAELKAARPTTSGVGYISDLIPAFDSGVLAVDSGSQLIMSFDSRGRLRAVRDYSVAAPAVSSTSAALHYAGPNVGQVIAFDDEGIVRWKQASEPRLGIPRIAALGTTVLASWQSGDTIDAYDRTDGDHKWTLGFPGMTEIMISRMNNSSALVTYEHDVKARSVNDMATPEWFWRVFDVSAVDDRGSILWKVQLPQRHSEILSAVDEVSRRIIVVGTRPGPIGSVEPIYHFYFISFDGKVLSEGDIPIGPSSLSSIATDKTQFTFGSQQGTLTSIREDGSVAWSLDFSEELGTKVESVRVHEVVDGEAIVVVNNGPGFCVGRVNLQRATSSSEK